MINKSILFLFSVLIGGVSHISFGQVINYDTKIAINENGKKKTKKTILIQVNNKNQKWLSHIELHHNPNQKFSVDYAHLLNGEGKIVRKIRKKDLITRNDLSYQAFYQDDLITEFDLYWNKYPYRVEYSYTLEEEEFLYAAWWTPVYYTNTSTMVSSLEVSVPSQYEFNVYSSRDLIHNEYGIDGKRILSWKTSYNRNDFTEEIYSASLEKLIPLVKVVPHEFKYGISGSSNSWSSYGTWLDQLNNGTDQITLDEQLRIEKLIEGLNDKREIVRTIYYYLQDRTKYVNVAIEVGGLKSYPASYVCENKYGDCKALTTYMKAMLKSVGIESIYTIIKAGENESSIDVSLPSQQFNHVILMVPLEEDSIWLENTSNSLPFNYLGTFTQKRNALAINGENSRLVKTPTFSLNDVLLERNFTIRLSNSKDVETDLDLTLRGNEFEDFRHYLSEDDERRQNDFLDKNIGIENFKIGNWKVKNFQRDSTFLSLTISGTSSSILRQIGTFQVVNPLKLDLPDFENPRERKFDVMINYPINRLDKSIYDLQTFENNEIQVPEEVDINSKYGFYQTHYSINNSQVIAVEKFALYANEISIGDYNAFYSFLNSIKKHKKNTSIIIK